MRVLHVIGRLGRGGDTAAVYSAGRYLKGHGCYFDYVTHEGYDPAFVEKLKAEGSGIYILKGDVRGLGILGYYRAFRNLLKDMSTTYDALHIHTSMQSGVALYAAKKGRIKKRICHAHTNSIQRPASGIKKKLIMPFFKYLINKYSTHKVACGVEAGDFLYGRNTNYTVIKNGVDKDKFTNVQQERLNALRKKLNLPEDCLIIGHVGRFSDMKNQKYSLSLFSKLSIHNANAFLVFVGDGENYNEVREMAKGMSANILFAGKRNDVEVFMSLFDVLLLPSFPGEGLPITLVEAQISGCYCISSDNVTKEADLGVGLLDYASLNDMNLWIDKILGSKKIIKPPHQDINSAIKKNKFDMGDTDLNWKRLYGLAGEYLS
ncbi:glycosyltransferase EpsF [Anaerobacterium chartisolvens]|uniref:Glycosyltransferase EpsF n=1 Tax=Anaerobacterium chartisolvens TaxID=1297424 RepID=A0A369BF78_9FIRM|nr:glycosyltransferase [Anaerobacterium chartisolvens]RCX19268.1 glycosyltransferase EpsF [Anaerobacterium chartisolvens]